MRTSLLTTYALIACCLAAVVATPNPAQDADKPKDPVEIFHRGQDLHEKKDLAGAIRLYEEALRIFPDFAEAEYQRGAAELALGNRIAAEKAFRRAIEIRADWALPMTSLASLLMRDGRFDQAEPVLKKAVELEPLGPPVIIALAELKLGTGGPAPVLMDLLDKISVLTAKANPTTALWVVRAALEKELGKVDAAKRSLAAAIALDPADRDALSLLADVAIGSGDVVRARDLVATLEKGEPAAENVKFLKARLAAYEGRLDEAAELLGQLSRQTRASTELSQRLTSLKQTNPAELEKQLAADPKNVTALGRLCSLYRRDDPAKAVEMCRRASEADPANLDHVIGYGAALLQAKEFAQAAALLRKVVDSVPDNATARANLAGSLFQLKRWEEARSEFQWLVNAQPRSPAGYLFLGIVHDQLTEYVDALANYQQFLRLADPVENKLDIEKVNLRLPAVEKLVRSGKGKKSGGEVRIRS
jgi:cellulose synthase operon protein C